MSFFFWLETTALAAWIQESFVAYPAFLSLHSVGMAFFIGIWAMVDIRLLGFAKSLNILEFSKLLKVALVGLLLNLLTGIGLFSTEASRFVASAPFLVKISCIVVGLVLSGILIRKKIPESDTWKDDEAPTDVKILAGFSLFFWLAAIFAGRLIAYI